MPSHDELIDMLTDDLKPVRSVSPAVGRTLAAVAALCTAAAVTTLFGMRRDLAAGIPHSVPLLAALVILMVGAAAAATVTAMARPAVGSMRKGWQWALAALAALPLAAIVTALGDPDQRAPMMPAEGLPCLVLGSLASIATVILLTLWLRRGAPTSTNRASWLVGVSGGAVGALAVGMICPANSITHIGIWHVGIIAVVAVLSRLTVPRLLRW